MRRPLVIAHRGASGQLPENTLPAYERAVEMGADMIEIDLHLTRDGAIAITHDEIGDASLEEVRARDARVPTLDQVLDGFGARIAFNLELKCAARGPYPGLEARTLEAVEARGLLGSTLFSCFEDPVLERLRELSAAARLGVLVSAQRPGGAVERARALGAESLHPWFGLAGPALLESAHGEGLAVYPYTVDEPDEMRRLLGLGADGLFTNHPERLRALVGPRII